MLAAAAQGSVAFLYALTRYASFKASGYDIGDFTQALYNFTSGRGLTVTLAPPHVPQHWLGVHFSPILYTLAPLYKAFPYAQTLLFVHAYAIAFAALPLFYAIKAAGIAPQRALLFAMLYLLNPFVLNAAIWDFHEIAFAPAFFACALWATVSRKRAAFLLSCALLVLVKEHYGLAVAGLGALWALHHGERRFGCGVALAGIAAFALVVTGVIPLLAPAHAHIMLGGGTGEEARRFAWRLTDVPELALEGAAYVGILLLVWLFLPLRAWIWLLPAVADVLVNTLSLHSMTRSVFSYHSAAIVPMLAFAAAMAQPGVARLRCLAAAAIFFGYTLCALPLPGAFNPWNMDKIMLRPATADEAAMDDIARLIPPDQPVAAQNNAAAHLAARAEIYQFAEADMTKAEWLVLRLPHPYPDGSDPFHAVYGVPRGQYITRVKEVFSDAGWGMVYYKHGWLVMKRGASDAFWRGRVLRDMKE